MKSLFVLVAALSLVAVSSCKKNNQPDSKDAAIAANDTNKDIAGSTTDARFAVEASDGGMLEVKLGELAQNNAAAEDVKFFGKSMREDHTKANNELGDIAKAKTIALPDKLSVKSQKTYDDL